MFASHYRYESIFLIYPSIDDVEESDSGIYNDAIDGAKTLKAELSNKQQDKAMAFAKTTLQEKGGR